MKDTEAIAQVIEELNVARQNYAPMNSDHEGYAVILEEFDEVWEEIKKRPYQKDRNLIRAEMKQVAAMALRFMIDLC